MYASFYLNGKPETRNPDIGATAVAQLCPAALSSILPSDPAGGKSADAHPSSPEVDFGRLQELSNLVWGLATLVARRCPKSVPPNSFTPGMVPLRCRYQGIGAQPDAIQALHGLHAGVPTVTRARESQRP